jgi:hypothetical protein
MPRAPRAVTRPSPRPCCVCTPLTSLLPAISTEFPYPTPPPSPRRDHTPPPSFFFPHFCRAWAPPAPAPPPCSPPIYSWRRFGSRRMTTPSPKPQSAVAQRCEKECPPTKTNIRDADIPSPPPVSAPHRRNRNHLRRKGVKKNFCPRKRARTIDAIHLLHPLVSVPGKESGQLPKKQNNRFPSPEAPKPQSDAAPASENNPGLGTNYSRYCNHLRRNGYKKIPLATNHWLPAFCSSRSPAVPGCTGAPCS